MRINTICRLPCALLWGVLACAPLSVGASVSVIVNGNTATAQIVLPDVNPTYQATVTITFDSVVNLTPDSLNITAELVDPNSFTGLPTGVSIDPNFPVLVSVEPPAFVFANSFEAGQVGNGNLDFLNTYEFEFHSDDSLSCSGPNSDFRLYKAPHGSNAFADVTDEIYTGSVRARGRGGAFSRFLIVHDVRPEIVLGEPVLALQKWSDLQTRLNAASLTSALRAPLTAALSLVRADILALQFSNAITDLDAFISDVHADAGNGMNDDWNAVDLGLNPSPNDAGELLSLAQTLRFTLSVLNGTAPVCQTPPV